MCKSKVGMLTYSHISEFWLPPDQDIPDPVNLKELSFNVIHGDGGVCHGHHVIL